MVLLHSLSCSAIHVYVTMLLRRLVKTFSKSYTARTQRELITKLNNHLLSKPDVQNVCLSTRYRICCCSQRLFSN